MNYDKLSRSLRYYYEKGIMQKVAGETWRDGTGVAGRAMKQRLTNCLGNFYERYKNLATEGTDRAVELYYICVTFPSILALP